MTFLVKNSRDCKFMTNSLYVFLLETKKKNFKSCENFSCSFKTTLNTIKKGKKWNVSFALFNLRKISILKEAREEEEKKLTILFAPQTPPARAHFVVKKRRKTYFSSVERNFHIHVCCNGKFCDTSSECIVNSQFSQKYDKEKKRGRNRPVRT